MSIGFHSAATALLAITLGALSAPSSFAIADETPNSIVPDCNGTSAEIYAQAICESDDLISKAKRIDKLSNDLLAKLPEGWKPTFIAQQSDFPSMANGCTPNQELLDCVGKAVNQRLQDLTDLWANLGKQLPACRSKDMTVADTGHVNGAMSQQIVGYVLEYQGTDPCSLRGFPSILVHDGKGTPQPSFAAYSGRSYFSNVAGPPLPVTLSSENRQAWFGLYSAESCDASADGEPLTLDVSLPLSQVRIDRIRLSEANCVPVTVTPIGMISTMLSSIY